MLRIFAIVILVALVVGGAYWWWQDDQTPEPNNGVDDVTYWGRVVDPLSRPVAGVQVQALELSTAIANALTQTNRQGRFSLTLPADYFPRIRLSKIGFANAQIELFPAPAAQDAVDYRLFPGGSFRARVTDLEGNPEPQAKVHLTGISGVSYETQTSHKGEFEIWGPIGPAVIAIHSRRFADARQFITLKANAEPSPPIVLEPGVTLELNLSGLNLSGSGRAAGDPELSSERTASEGQSLESKPPEGKPLAGVLATVWTAAGDRESRRSDLTGRLTIPGLQPGRTELTLTRRGRVAEYSAFDLVDPLSIQTLRLSLAPEWSLDLRDSNGDPIAPDRVRVYQEDHLLLAANGAGPNLQVLDPNQTYRLWIEAPKHAADFFEVRLSQVEDHNVVIELERGNEVRGQLIEPDGTGIAGARIEIFAADTESKLSMGLSHTTHHGRFRTQRLPSGAYRARVTPRAARAALTKGTSFDFEFSVPKLSPDDTIELEPTRFDPFGRR